MPKQKSENTIADLTPDPENRRKHNPRNIGMIEEALHRVGAARSIVIDENGKILAGEGTVEAAAQAGITKLKIVDADGETLVAVRRKGLTEEQKRELGLFDNRTAELSDWNGDQMIADLQKGESFDGLFSNSELERLLEVELPETEEKKPRKKKGGDPDSNVVVCPECGATFTP